MPRNRITFLALLLLLGIATPAIADSSPNTDPINSVQSRHSMLPLTLEAFSNSALTLPDKATAGMSLVALNGLGSLHTHGHRDAVNSTTTPNPEPATMLLLGSGLVGIVGAVRKKRRR